jgi:DNA repair protein RadD
MALRDYQRDWLNRIYNEWRAGNKDVLATLPTGAGKTFSFVTAVREMGVPACIIAHRMELVSQAALALNREQMPHNIEAPQATIRAIIEAQMTMHGRSFYSNRAPVHVAGVHTLAARGNKIRWASSIGLVVVDEGHHVTKGGIWDEARQLFPNAFGLYPTAHAIRADGLGLGRGADGLADALVIGPSARSLINRGFLSDYRLALPPSDIDISSVPVGASGEFVQARLAAEVHKSKTLVGDVAAHYLKFAAGKLGLTFAVDIEEAHKIAAAYNALGVPAAVITGKTPIQNRADMMRRLRNRQLLQLVSVDVLGEGTDVPAVEVVSLARHTMSFQLHAQMIGRALRVQVGDDLARQWDTFTDEQRLAYIAAGPKPFAMIIDHVGNFLRHYAKRGMPCSSQSYALTRPEKGERNRRSDAIPLRTCLNESCLQPYERVLPECPYCATPAPAPAGRGSPEQVEGDLVLLDPAAMAALCNEVQRIDDVPRIPQDVSPLAAAGIKKQHFRRQQGQHSLRRAMTVVCGYWNSLGYDMRRQHREFFHRFGVDTMTAQALGVNEAEELEFKITAYLLKNNVSPVAAPVMMDTEGAWELGPNNEVIRL